MITAVVRFPLPAGTTRDDAKAMFEKSAPNYRGVPGLVRKYYLFGDDRTGGGVYLWNSREVAERFYSDAWKRTIAERYGAQPGDPLLRDRGDRRERGRGGGHGCLRRPPVATHLPQRIRACLDRSAALGNTGPDRCKTISSIPASNVDSGEHESATLIQKCPGANSRRSDTFGRPSQHRDLIFAGNSGRLHPR